MVVVRRRRREPGAVVPEPEKVAVVAPSELDVAAVVWARSLLVSQAALAGRRWPAPAAGAAAEAAEEASE